MARFLALLVAFSLLGCSDDTRTPGGRDTGPADDTGTPSDTGTGRDTNFGDRFVPPPEDECDKIDFLFIVDDSGSMGEEQANLAENFPRFVEIVDRYRTEAGSPLDYRLGVTTTGKDITTVITFNLPGIPFPPMEISETGPTGALLQECGMTRKWIESGDPDVAGTFSCLAEVGTSGSGVEMPLYMTELALTERIADGSNAGFLRDDALLAVVILTDEDDCSRPEDRIEITLDVMGGAAGAADTCDPDATMPVARFLTALDGVKGDRGRWAAAIIAGPGPGTCSSSFGDAAEATRLQQFTSDAGMNVVFSSICDGDLSGSLETALDTFEAACQSFPPLI